MLILLIIAIAGLLWLAHRFSVLLSVPLESSVKALNIKVPNVPLISVDKVTHSSMVLHWDVTSNSNSEEEDSNTVEPKDQNASQPQIIPQPQPQPVDAPPILTHVLANSISHYVLYINGIQAAIINGRQNSCVLEGLSPDSNYQVDLVAFNMTDFRSKSSPIYVKTAANQINKDVNVSIIDHPDELIKCLLPENEKENIVRHEPFKQSTPINRSRSNTLDIAENNGVSHSSNSNNENNKEHPHLIEDINELKWLLEGGLDEVKSLINSYKETEAEFKEEEDSLIVARDEARERRKYEDNNRSSLRQEIKLLEEQRLKADNRISADQRKLALRLKKIEQKENQIETWRSFMVKLLEEKEVMIKEGPLELENLRLQIQELNKDIFSIQAELHDVEEDLRDELSNRKRLDHVKQKLDSLFADLELNIDNQTGLLRPEGVSLFEKLIDLQPSWEDELRKEIITIDEEAEANWRSLQQNEFNRVENIKKQIEEQKKSVDDRVTNSYLKQYGANAKTNNDSNNLSFKSNTFNGNSLNNIIRPRLQPTNSFQGLKLSPENQLVQMDSEGQGTSSASNTFNSTAGQMVWNGANNNSNSMNLSLNNKATQMLQSDSNTPISPDVNFLLPQNLIEGGDLVNIFDNPSNPSSLSQHPLPVTANNTASNTVSPNVSQVGFDLSKNSGLDYIPKVLNTPQNNRVTPLGALTNSANSNSLLSSSVPMNVLNSPQSFQATQLHTSDSMVSPCLLDISAPPASSSPFNSNTPMNLSLKNSVNNSSSQGNDLDDLSVMFNQSSMFDPFGTTNSNSSNDKAINSSHYSKLLNTLGNSSKPSNKVIGSEDTMGEYKKNSLDFSISRARSTSFGSSIWSNNNNSKNTNWAPNPFSLLGAPISMATNGTNSNLNLGLEESKSNYIDNNSLKDNSSLVPEHSRHISEQSMSSIFSDDNEDSFRENQSSSPSFLKTKLFKFSASPTKNKNNDMDNISMESCEHTGSNNNITTNTQSHHRSNSTSASGFLSSGFGTSRFFKLPRKSSAASQQSSIVIGASTLNENTTGTSPAFSANNNSTGSASVNSAEVTGLNFSPANATTGSSSSSGGFMSRKLSFAFKRDKDKDKDKDKNGKIDEEIM